MCSPETAQSSGHGMIICFDEYISTFVLMAICIITQVLIQLKKAIDQSMIIYNYLNIF